MSSSCRDIDSLVTPYVDGALEPSDRDLVDRHVRHCAACRSRLDAERSVRKTLETRRAALAGECAPSALAARCAAAAVSARRRWRLAPLALAATLVVATAGALLYRATESSTRVMAAELAADHVKCFLINEVMGTRHEPGEVAASMEAHFGWDVQLPPHPEAAGLELVGARPCLYAEGRMAHIMYRYRGRPVSVFMLPHTARADERLEVLGHEAAIWSSGDHTFVLIAQEPKDEMTRLASFVLGSLQ